MGWGNSSYPGDSVRRISADSCTLFEYYLDAKIGQNGNMTQLLTFITLYMFS